MHGYAASNLEREIFKKKKKKKKKLATSAEIDYSKIQSVGSIKTFFTFLVILVWSQDLTTPEQECTNLGHNNSGVLSTFHQGFLKPFW